MDPNHQTDLSIALAIKSSNQKNWTPTVKSGANIWHQCENSTRIKSCMTITAHKRRLNNVRAPAKIMGKNSNQTANKAI